MRSVPDAFIAAKNAETAEPIWLYRIHSAGVAGIGVDLFLAAYHENVEFYKDTDTAQTYTAFEIERGTVRHNDQGGVDSMQMAFANASQEFQAWCDVDGNGLRGLQVTVRETYKEFLSTEDDDNTAYLEDIFVIDSAILGWPRASFALTPPNAFTIGVPYRVFQRETCAWKYQGEGCWRDDGAGGVTQPTGWLNGTPNTCQKSQDECERHANLLRFGGYPSLPTDGTVWL